MYTEFIICYSCVYNKGCDHQTLIDHHCFGKTNADRDWFVDFGKPHIIIYFHEIFFEKLQLIVLKIPLIGNIVNIVVNQILKL